MSSKLAWGYYPTTGVWLPIQVDSSGRIKVDMSNINLGDLSDVSVAAPTDDYFIYWDAATSLWKCRALVDADIPSTIARDSEVAALLAALGFTDLADTPSSFSDQALKVPRVNSGESALEFSELTYAMAESYLLQYLLSRKLARFMHIQFDSYDMIDEYTGGTGYVVKNFFAPYVRSGATSGGWAILCQNAEWLYVDRDSIFYEQGYYVSNIRDGKGFIGVTGSNNHVIAKDDTVKHAGFVFYVSGATQTVYAQSGDGSNYEQTDTGADPETFASWAMISDGSTIKFYRNWTLVATHDTRIPSGALAWKISTVSAENQDNAIVARNLVYSQIS